MKKLLLLTAMLGVFVPVSGDTIKTRWKPPIYEMDGRAYYYWVLSAQEPQPKPNDTTWCIGNPWLCGVIK